MPGGGKFYVVALGCTPRMSDDELLSYVTVIRNVQRVALAPVAPSETGMNALLQLKELAILDVTDTGISDEAVCRLKRHRPNLVVNDSGKEWKEHGSGKAFMLPIQAFPTRHTWN